MGWLAVPPESWQSIGRRLARHPRPVIWSWVAIRGQECWELAGVSIRGDVDREPCRHDYGDVRIVVERLSGAAAARRWRRGIATGRGAPARFRLEPINSPIPVQMMTSRGQRPPLGGPSEWPVFLLTTGLPGVSMSSLGSLLHNSLHQPSSPFFPTLAAALGEVVFDANPWDMARYSLPHLLVRLDAREARIAAVTATEGRIEVDAQFGEDVGADLVLRVAWRETRASTSWKRHDQILSTPGAFLFEPEQIPVEFVAAIVDHHGRVLDQDGWGEGSGPSLDQLASLDARVMRWLSLGEGEGIEYKRRIGEPKVNLSLAETMTAFANGHGGVILVGVADDGSVLGSPDEKLDDQVQNIVRSLVNGPISFQTAGVAIDGAPVHVITVAPALEPDKPLLCKDRVMIRVGATTRVAAPWEIRRFGQTTG